MSKEIEFRGISRETKKTVFGMLMYSVSDSGLVIVETVDCPPSMLDPCGDTINIYHGIVQGSESQFTGREDSEINGERVYDNDIIENCDTKDLQVVFWNENKSAWYCRYISDNKRIVSLSDSLGNLNKKVGNIFQNAELLQNAV